MGDGKDIQIGNAVIGESTKISLSVKTALWIIGVVIGLFSTIFTVAYFDVKSDMELYKKKADENNEAFIKEIQESINTKLDKQRDKDERFIEDIAKIKGDIQLILDRTQRLGGTPAEGAPTIGNNNPTTTIPNRNH